ncbi:MAG: glycosyl transferase family 2 [Myxococcales bacterium]|nr:glycosyl transferase family 2 [Myxococcales bacterium]|tara:strand:- start:83 stop:1072 length:990 start_codon:yes stop_codon:yes gene_type:complete
MLTIVLPVYNESESILECLQRLYGVLKNDEHEILVCYDFDEDTTLPILEKVKDKYPTMRLVKNAYGRGAAKAIKSGIEDARGDIIVTTMADLSDPPEIIPKMVEKIQKGAWVVSASRYIPGGSITGAPFLKEKLSMLAGLTLNLLTGISTRDVTNNFRAYKRELFEHIKVESLHGFEIGLELTVKAFRLGFSVSEVPSQWEERQHGETKFQLFKWLPFYLKWYLYGLMPTLLCISTALLLLLVNLSFSNTSLNIFLSLLLGFVFLFLRKRRIREQDVISVILLMNPMIFILENKIAWMGYTIGLCLVTFIAMYNIKLHKRLILGLNKDE